jgi:hypothetical protein
VSDNINTFEDDDDVVIDFTKIHDSNDVRDGTYIATVVHSQPGLSKKGEKKIELRWKIDEGELEGVTVFDNLSFAPGALARTRQSLIGAGFPQDYNGSVREIASELLNVQACITVKTDTKPSTQTDPNTGEPYPQRPRVIRIRPTEAYEELDAAFGS